MIEVKLVERMLLELNLFKKTCDLDSKEAWQSVMKRKVWVDRNLDYAADNMLRIIEMTGSLNKLREEEITL